MRGDAHPCCTASIPRAVRLALALALLLATVSGTLGCTSETPDDTPEGWAVGVDAIPSSAVFVVRDHFAALPIWVEAGARERTVVHIDAHDDFRFIDEDRLGPVREAVAAEDATAVAALADEVGVAGGYNLGDYLYAAAATGVLDRIVWVQPRDPADPVAFWREWLTAQGYPADDVATFAADGDAVSGTLLGVNVTIASIGSLPAIDEPVLLDIDVDHFPLLALEGTYDNATGTVRDTMLALREQGIRTDLVTMATSLRGGYTPVQFAWMTDVVFVSLVQPSILDGAPSDRWIEMGDAVVREVYGDAEGALAAWDRAIEDTDTDPSAWFGRGRLRMLAGEAAARDDLDRAIALDPAFAEGLIQVARELAANDRTDDALELLESANGRADPFYLGLARADILYNAGSYGDARLAYEDLSERYTHPDVWMFLGDTYAALGVDDDALTAYAEGEALLARSTFVTAADYPDALPWLGRLAEERGDTEDAIARYELYLELRPDGPDAEGSREALARLGG